MIYPIKYTLIAEVDDEVVFESTYETTADLEFDLHKPEYAVEVKLEELQRLDDLEKQIEEEEREKNNE